MAGRPGQPGGQPQYSLPKLAPEEQFVQKKQGEYIQADVRQLSMHMDVETAFRDVKDAISRLLPFHVSSSHLLAAPSLAQQYPNNRSSPAP